LKHYIVNIKRNNASLIGIIHNSVNPHKTKCFMSIALFGRKMLRRALFGRFFLFVGGVGGRERERERERERAMGTKQDEMTQSIDHGF
jgi:hypothetical protein